MNTADVTVTIDESQRQMLLLALAKLSLERPGWYWTLGELSAKFTAAPAGDDGRALFEQFRKIHANPFHDHLEQCAQCSGKPFDLCTVGAALLRREVGRASE